MTCEEAKALLLKYMDGELEKAQEAAFSEHISSCAVCSEYLQANREAKGILKSRPRVLVPADMDAQFLKKLAGEPGKGEYTPFPRNINVRMTAAYAMALAAVFMIFSFLNAPRPVLSAYNGTVKIFLAKSNSWTVLEGKTRIGAGDIVKTFDNSGVDMDVPGVCSIRLKQDTEIRIAKLGSRLTGSDIKYDLIKGKALIYHNQTAMKASKFKIATDEAVSTAIGTDFAVCAFPESNKTWVGVLEGQVLVNSAADLVKGVMVNAGQKTEVYAKGLPKAPEFLEMTELKEMGELYQIGVKPQAALLISMRPDRVRELLRMCPIYISDKKDSDIAIPLKDAVKTFNTAVLEKDSAKHMLAISRFKSIISDNPKNKYNVQLILFVGAYYNYLGKYDEAIDAFESIIIRYPDSHLASLAETAIALVYEEGLKDKAKALSAYNKVISRYPSSPECQFAKDALVKLSKTT